MEISFENKVFSSYREISHQVKRIQETAESVVPDTNDDIGKIASVQTAVFLKSKDVNSRGVVVTGEARAALIYVTESEREVSYVRLSKQFTLEYDIGEVDAGTVAQVKLSIQNCQANVLNPRKVSVVFDLAGELSCYMQENIVAETDIPEATPQGLHAKYESLELSLPCAVAEKTFTVNEQHPFSSGKPRAKELVSQNIDITLSDCQIIGTKVVIKGSVNLTVCYLSDEVNYPVKADFSSPFSQIIDTMEENMDSCRAIIELTSAYCDIIDTINGEKALDAEIHGVLQIVSSSKHKIKYISDAYSNLMPAKCITETKKINTVSDVQQTKLISDERINVVEDCSDVLSVFSSVTQLNIQSNKITAAVSLDIIYRTVNGTLSAVRRLVNMENECSSTTMSLTSAALTDIYLRPDGPYIDSHLAVEVNYQCCSSMEIERVTSVELDEEHSFDFSRFPAVSLVRVEKESLWELSKQYHSSVEAIKSMNDIEEETENKLLLIPKEI
ncbi:MAG: DUF3794 domain-containing protein [Candidatus Limivicinus sp.]|jgi:hypothetical protein